MKYFLITFFTLSFSLSAQQTELKKMINTTYEAKAYLIPSKPHDFTVKKGTRVKFILKMTNSGNEEYQLNKINSLMAYYMEKASEKPFDFKLEKMSQENICKAKIKTLSNRLKAVRNMQDSEAIKYAERLNLKGLDSKATLMSHLLGELEGLRENQAKAAEFDKNYTVKPGVTLNFAGSGFLPEVKDTNLKSCNLTLKVFNKEGKHISIPVQAVFY